MRALLGAEVEVVPEGGEAVRVGVIGTAVDVGDQRGGGAVGAPELLAMRAVVGGEVEEVPEGGEAVQFREATQVRVVSPAVDVGDQRGGGAVGAPELFAVRFVKGEKVKPVTEGGEKDRVGVIGAAVDVFDQRRGGAIRAPEFPAVCGVSGAEVEVVPEGGEIERGRGVRTRVDRVNHGQRRHTGGPCRHRSHEQQGQSERKRALGRHGRASDHWAAQPRRS